MFCTSISTLLLHVVNIISMRTLKSFRTMLKKFQIIFEYNLKIIAQYFVGRKPQSPKALSLMAVSMTKKDTFLYLRLNEKKYECD